jgi:hypothetical protein
MDYTIIPERRSNSYSDTWVRENKNGTKEYFNKEFYHSDFTRKYSLEDIQKEILLFQIESMLLS